MGVESTINSSVSRYLSRDLDFYLCCKKGFTRVSVPRFTNNQNGAYQSVCPLHSPPTSAVAGKGLSLGAIEGSQRPLLLNAACSTMSEIDRFLALFQACLSAQPISAHLVRGLEIPCGIGTDAKTVRKEKGLRLPPTTHSMPLLSLFGAKRSGSPFQMCPKNHPHIFLMLKSRPFRNFGQR